MWGRRAAMDREPSLRAPRSPQPTIPTLKVTSERDPGLPPWYRGVAVVAATGFSGGTANRRVQQCLHDLRPRAPRSGLGAGLLRAPISDGGAKMSFSSWSGSVALMLLVLSLSLPRLGHSDPDCDFDDITVGYCTNGGGNIPGTRLHMHPCSEVECFKFFRRACGASEWTLIYEGPENIYCDPDYDPGDCVQYKGQRWTDLSGLTQCAGTLHSESPPSICPSGC
jgi:hypothetical protein